MPVQDAAAAVDQWKHRAPRYTLFRDYYNGQHSLKFATPNFVEKYGQIIKSLRENLCPAVVSAFTDRLSITAWTGDGETAALDESVEQGVSRLVNLVHREAFRTGDAFALVWPGADGTPKATYHRADEIVPHVDPVDPDRLDWAAKVWYDRGLRRGRVNVYYTDRVERYRTLAEVHADQSSADLPSEPTAWVPHADDDGAEVIGHTFGAVPVCWWKRDADDQRSGGRSVLADVIPLQDALNKSVADLVVTSETYSRPFWYLLNHAPGEARIDPATGLPGKQQALGQKFDPTRQQVFTTDGPGPFGQLTPPDLTRLLTIQDGYAHKIARVVGVPTYYFSQTSGDVPSGESLRVLSSRLTAGVEDFQQDASPVWRGLMQLLGHDVSPEWASAAPMDEAEKLDAAVTKKQLGYPLVDILRDLGEADAEDIAARAGQANESARTAAARLFAEGNFTEA
ncbi:phage portal protein [Propionibacteriaceae bacterium Y1700]|uniref:phage portal protein n=1 Tax=Microlunatus sp. Y1700 TaxID=3418487 RepID=UPI003DA7460C